MALDHGNELHLLNSAYLFHQKRVHANSLYPAVRASL